MPLISTFPFLSGPVAPDYTYTGQSIYTEKPEDGVLWRLVLTTSGTLTLNKNCKVKRLAAQGGGGGSGASSGSTNGSDGTDGSIQTMTNTIISYGSYVVTIGSGGSKPSYMIATAGNGGTTSFGDMLTAEGGAGGSYSKGTKLTHSSIYESYGIGATGGTPRDYTGSIETVYSVTVKNTGYMYIRTEPRWNSSTNGTISYGTYVELTSNDQYPDTSGHGDYFYRLADGSGYVKVSDCGPLKTESRDRRVWYGFAGNSGVVLLEG